MKSVLISIQPYYVFLIIAQLMGWDIPQRKTEEVRKDLPKDKTWDRNTHIYCSKNQKSFKQIPAKYRQLMEKFLGTVVGVFVCDNIRRGRADNAIAAYYHNNPDETCLSDLELREYATTAKKPIYFWHILGLTVYKTPKALGEFRTSCKIFEKRVCGIRTLCGEQKGICDGTKVLARPPQSWCYVEAI